MKISEIFIFQRKKYFTFMKSENFQKNIFSTFKIICFSSKILSWKKVGPLSRCKIVWRIHFSHSQSDLTSISPLNPRGNPHHILQNIRDSIPPKIWQRHVPYNISFRAYLCFCPTSKRRRTSAFRNGENGTRWNSIRQTRSVYIQRGRGGTPSRAAPPHNDISLSTDNSRMNIFPA